MFAEPNPICVNTALAMCGLVNPVFRLPYVPLSAQQRAAGEKLLTPLLVHIPGAEHIQVTSASVSLLSYNAHPQGANSISLNSSESGTGTL